MGNDNKSVYFGHVSDFEKVLATSKRARHLFEEKARPLVDQKYKYHYAALAEYEEGLIELAQEEITDSDLELE